MSASDLQSLNTRLASLSKRAGESELLVEMLAGQLRRQQSDLREAQSTVAALANDSTLAINQKTENSL
jgi:hypothetical protein